jgi:hypothetical protein
MKILILDSDLDSAVALGIGLRRLGQVPLLAIDPDSAAQMVTRDVEGAIISLDTGKAGLCLARHLRRFDCHIPILFCSDSHSSPLQLEEAACLGPVAPRASCLGQVQRLLTELRRAPIVRRDQRHRAKLTVRYPSAHELRQEYTENLSRGGCFVRGATDLRPHETVHITVDLPGLGTFEADAEVAYVLDEDGARQRGRSPGAGLTITAAEPDAIAVLGEYMRRLERRQYWTVLTCDEAFRIVLAESGYQTSTLSQPAELAHQLEEAPRPVVAVVVPSRLAARYRAAAPCGVDPRFVVAIDDVDQLDDLLGELDRKL